MSSDQLYDRIGHGYAARREPDPRVAAQVMDALGDPASVINVGAGTGNYEPIDRRVLAVEPSIEMLSQRTNDNPTVQAFAESLPVADDSFDAALAMFTIHHWPDAEAGLAELARVSNRQVALIYDVDVTAGYWLLDYFPELSTAPWELDAPTPAWIGQHLELIEVRELMVPHDCSDGFSGAFWNRPDRYLDPGVQQGMSTLARLDPADLAAGTERLRSALDSGEWDRTHGHLRDQEWFDIGYRLVVCAGATRRASNHA